MTDTDLQSHDESRAQRRPVAPTASHSRLLESLVRSSSSEPLKTEQDVRKILGDCTRGVDLQRSPTLTGFVSR
jgi:hypothetical protein